MEFNDNPFNSKFYGIVNLTADEIQKLFDKLLKEVAPLIEKALTEKKGVKRFKFSLDNKLKVQSDLLFKQFSRSLKAQIDKSTLEVWTLSNAKTDKMIEFLADKTGLDPIKIKAKYEFGARNEKAYEQFSKRKINKETLSTRVWNLTKETREGIEIHVTEGIKQGKPAREVAKAVRGFLNNPNPLPITEKVGQGVYRNPAKNAMRLARTEVNSSYRQADYDRWQKLDFVVGIRVKVSTNNNQCPMCLGLQGLYPKGFLFRGWHPQCLCVAVPINMSIDDFVASQNGQKVKSKIEVKALPVNFQSWWQENAQRLLGYKSVPMFFEGNEKYLFK